MSNKRITDLTELTTPTTDDVLPIVDIATNTTQKVQVGNLPTTTAVTTALATKQDTLVSGTNIKTVNLTSLVGSGNVAVQETLVSGTNIKTINSTSLLGSGNITIAANPSGVSGAIQFSNGSAFASDAANLFWDDTNNRLGVGTNAPSHALTIDANTTDDGLIMRGPTDTVIFQITKDGNTLNSSELFQYNAGVINFALRSPGNASYFNNGTFTFGANTNLGAKVNIKGSGSTSATTSLLVQNSSGTAALTIKDDLSATFGGNAIANNFAGTGYFSLSSEQRLVIGVAPNRTLFIPIGSGILCMSDGAETNFNRLQLGGTTSSYPSIKRASNNIEIKNADDTFGAGFSVGSALNASAILQASSTTKGFLPPVMTTTQKNAIATPASGLVVYDSTTNKLCCYNGSTWNDLF